jgi:uncharacterized damage-inducible protein DinB
MALLLQTVQPRPGTRGWHGGPTVLGSLRGVDARQAGCKPAPRRHSIWELALHAAYWKYAVRKRLEPGRERFARSPANWPAPSGTGERAWADDRALLQLEHERLMEVLARFPAERLDGRPAGGRRWNYEELILGIALHDTYHTGQIQLVKRLWQDRRGSR